MFLTVRNKQIRNKINKTTTFANIDLLYFSTFIFKKHGFIEEDKLSENVVIFEEELDRFDIDGIENLENLPRFVFINKECGNLKVVNDDGINKECGNLKVVNDDGINQSINQPLFISLSINVCLKIYKIRTLPR